MVTLLRPFIQPVRVAWGLLYRKLVASILQREQQHKPVMEYLIMVRAAEVEVQELHVVDIAVQRSVLVQYSQHGVLGAP